MKIKLQTVKTKVLKTMAVFIKYITELFYVNIYNAVNF